MLNFVGFLAVTGSGISGRKVRPAV